MFSFLQSTYEVDFALRIWIMLLEECVLLAKRAGLIHSFEVCFNKSSINWKSIADVCWTHSNIFINTRKHTDINVITGSQNFFQVDISFMNKNAGFSLCGWISYLFHLLLWVTKLEKTFSKKLDDGEIWQ